MGLKQVEDKCREQSADMSLPAKWWLCRCVYVCLCVNVLTNSLSDAFTLWFGRQE